jgi:hypothetical protein
MRSHRHSLTVTVLVVSLLALMSTAAGKAKPEGGPAAENAVVASPHDKLALWAGHWKVRIDTKETQFGHASTEYFDAKCSFFPNNIFLYCDYLSLQSNAESNGGVMDDVSLLYYSGVDKTFKYTNVAAEGGPNENTMQVDGNVWTRPFDITRRSGGVAKARAIYTFASADKQFERLEISIDNGEHWTVVHEAVGTRAP